MFLRILQSETYSILDCLFYDRANQSSHYDDYVNYNSYLDVTYTSDYTDLKENSAEHGRYSIASSNSYIAFPLGIRFECDLKCVDGESSSTPLRIMNANATSQLSNPSIANLGLTIGEFGHFTIDITEDGMLITRGDGTTTTRLLPSTTTTNVAFAFWTHGAITELQFKNVLIYPI